MARVISVSNQKGGVGKTTVAVNLAAALAYLGKTTLLIDADPQGSATLSFGIDRYTVEASLHDALTDNKPIKETILRTSLKGLYFIPSSPLLAGADVELATLYEKNRFSRLKEVLKDEKKNYDFVIIDCPPAIGLNVNAMNASDEVIIPCTCDFLSEASLLEAYASVRRIKSSFNKKLSVGGIVINNYDSKSKSQKAINVRIRETFSASRVYNHEIPTSAKIVEAQEVGKTIVEYAPKTSITEAYIDLAREVINNVRED